jgi:hypothetical protein
VLTLDRHARPVCQSAHAPPRHASANPVGSLERVEAPTGAVLSPAERAVDPPSVRLPASAFGQKAPQRLLGASEDRAAEVTAQRPCVFRHLTLDRDHDLAGKLGQFRLDCGSSRRVETTSYANSIRNRPLRRRNRPRNLPI